MSRGDPLPPLHIINKTLGFCEWDDGHCHHIYWGGIELSQQDYEQMQQVAKKKKISIKPIPSWVVDCQDWNIFLYERRHEVPDNQLLRVCRQMDYAFEQASIARSRGNTREEEIWNAEYRSANDARSKLYAKFFGFSAKQFGYGYRLLYC